MKISIFNQTIQWIDSDEFIEFEYSRYAALGHVQPLSLIYLPQTCNIIKFSITYNYDKGYALEDYVTNKSWKNLKSFKIAKDLATELWRKECFYKYRNWKLNDTNNR